MSGCFTPEFGADEIPVSPRGDLDGEYGFQSDSFRFEGVITAIATAADGTTLTGDVTWPRCGAALAAGSVTLPA